MTKDKKLFETGKADRTQAVELEDTTLDQASGGAEPVGRPKPAEPVGGPKTAEPISEGR